MAPQTDVLNLFTSKRPIVNIDDKPYKMRTPSEFAFEAFDRQQKSFARLGLLLRKKRKTNAERQERTRLLDQFVRQILIEAPDKAHEALDDSLRMEIVAFFFKQRRPTPKPTLKHGASVTATA